MTLGNMRARGRRIDADRFVDPTEIQEGGLE
jgi:hypothetical protein